MITTTKKYRYEFTITLSGIGSNPEEAWFDAVTAFELDPGECEGDHVPIEEVDEEEED